jgi:hypothetical protein
MSNERGPNRYVGPEDGSELNTGGGYALSGKIMLSAIVILLFVVVLMVGLHLYARWYLLRARRRHSRRPRRRTRIVFYVDSDNANNVNAVAAGGTRGLDAFVLSSLPVFVYSSKTHQELPECAVCLSEFEENETGRTLPKCNHSFHIGCIDMWFHSHSTCPLCRSTVEPGTGHGLNPESREEVVISVNDPGPSSELCSDCQHEDSGTGMGQASSSGGARKPVEFAGVSVEIPRRNESFRDEYSLSDSPASQGGFRSPMSRMLSFTRILSRDRRSSVSPTSANVVGVSCGGTESAAESDIERGTRNDETR